MDCNKCIEQMSLHLDNMADGDQKEFQQHLRSCKECRSIFERMASTREHLGSLPEEEVPEGFHEAWMKAAVAQKARTQKPNLKWVRIAGPIAAALVVAVIGWQAFANGLFGQGPSAAPAPMAITMDKQESAQRSIAAATAAPTMAPAATAAPQQAMDSAMGGVESEPSSDNPFAAARQEAVSYTITGKPEAQQDLQDLLKKWNIESALNDQSGNAITFSIGPEHYNEFMEWLKDKGAEPPPPAENPPAENAGTKQFEITFN